MGELLAIYFTTASAYKMLNISTVLMIYCLPTDRTRRTATPPFSTTEVEETIKRMNPGKQQSLKTWQPNSRGDPTLGLRELFNCIIEEDRTPSDWIGCNVKKERPSGAIQ